jgi:hypothetical protein
MKKIVFLMMMVFTISLTAFAQEKVVKKEDKVKRTSTFSQKVHNTFSRHKHYNGYKTKHIKKVEKVN